MRMVFIMQAAFLAACAMPVHREAAVLVSPAASDAGRTIEMDSDVSFKLSTGYFRTIRTGSRWQLKGNVDGKDVYRSVKGVFTIEGTHVHEAWLVLDGNDLAGFYLAGENAVSWLDAKVALNFH